ncbi:hypothetical protein LB565_02700 [Mesorhizobium sp. CA14]|uniref:DUF6894 family protein n=1 Tax=Mesorhizobium sp. CA14 TaxID=2876642 RepID=UPI001CCB2199|nr:hypothetical protein [Mesorhizobium sp. CA14]MBZ9846895.1 hypothetical protein [Mesorhizobium sp. CA14]
MQVLGAEVHTGLDGMIVEFLGEGGEKIAVTMPVSDPRLRLDKAALVARAKGMMAQCAVFDNSEGLQSSQDSHLARPATSTKLDGPFTFEYRDKGSVRQLEGVELASLEVAHDEALRSAIDLLDDAATEGGQEGWAVRVRDGSGKIVSSVDFDEARREKAAAE